MSTIYPRLTCFFIFLWHSSTCVLGQTVNQVSNNFQPNQWTNSLVAPNEARFWTKTSADAKHATARVTQMASPQLQTVSQMPPGQVMNPYALAVPSAGAPMVGTAIAGPITQVRLPTVDMTPVRVEPVVVPTAPGQRIAQKASEMRTAMGQLNPFQPRANNASAPPAIVHQAADLAAITSNAIPAMTTGVAYQSPPLYPSRPLTQSAPNPYGQQPRQTWGQSITAAATQPNFTGPPVIGTPLRVAASADASNIPGRTGAAFGSEPPIEDLPTPPNGSPPQPLIQQTPTPNLPLPPIGQAAPTANSCCSGGQCQISPGAGSCTNPPILQTQPLSVYSNQLLVHPNQLTPQISQRDLQAFIANSVNAYCAPQQQQCLPQRKPVAGTLCGCRSTGTSCLWSRFETLIYWLKGYDVPALVTSSPAGTPLADVGVLGLPTTTTRFGDSSIGESLRTGGRLNLGFWAVDDRSLGVEGEFFALGSSTDDDYSSVFGGNRIIARPYFNTDPAVDAPAAEIVNLPGVVDGFVDVDTSGRIYSGAATVRYNFKCRCSKPNVQSRFDLLAGYRYFHLGETLGIYELIEPTGGAAGSTTEFYDEYRTWNDLHSVEFGINWMRQHNRHYLELLGTVAIGEVTRTAEVSGFSNVFIPGLADDSYPGGFYAHPSQQGRTFEREFAVLPQARAKYGFYITPTLRVFAGYDFLYLNSVVRPNSHIDQSVNPADLLTAGRPPRRLRRNLPDEEVWLQGASFGLLYNF